MIVKFATTCDYFDHSLPSGSRICGKRSEEYTAWPTCRNCNDHTCPDHMKVGSKTEADVDKPETCLCLDCEE